MSDQQALPRDFEAQARVRYDKIPNPEVPFDRYLQIEKQEFQRRQQTERQAMLYHPTLQPGMSPCGNGDFETTLDPSQWQGAYGSVPTSGNPDFATFTLGISSGSLNSPGARQTRVGPGTDPLVGIPTTGPLPNGAPSAGAIRIGNQVNGAGSELLVKTLVVTAATRFIKFWYAVVLEDPPGHSAAQKPSFWVRVTANSILQPGLVNLGNGSDKLWSDTTNPFFLVKPGPNGVPLAYKKWTCAQIDLSQYVGQTVSIEFVTEDCSATGHFGYAYIDNFCGDCAGSPEGGISFDASTSSTCGPGKLCFNYTLPWQATATGTTTGSITITLRIYQNGALLTTMTSPTLTTGTSYCFNITPSSIPGINTALGGFDFAATGAFALGSATLAPMLVGAAPDGRVAGLNNDYRMVCKWCCPGTNLVENGDFEGGNVGIGSQYVFNGNVSLGATLPGQYNVVDSAGAAAISPLWVATDHFACNGGSGTSKFMVVNGKTGQTGSRVIWSRNVAVTAGKEYRFCAYVKNLRQSSFDILPKLQVTFIDPGNVAVPSTVPPATVVNTTSAACAWQLISGSLWAPGATMTIQISLDETGLGDGNDLALDDISFQEKAAMNPAFVLVNVATNTGIGGGKYTVTANPVNLPSGYGYYWEVAELDNAGNATVVQQNPSPWWGPFPCLFAGFDGSTPTVLSGTSPGQFNFTKRYRIRFGAWQDCVSWGESSWILQYNVAARTVDISKVPPAGAATDVIPVEGRGTAVRR